MRYEGEKIQRIEKALLKSGPARVMVEPHKAGRFVWSPLPLETANSMDALVAFYQFALAVANVSPAFTVSPDKASLLVLPSVFRQHALYALISESENDSSVTLTHGATRTPVSVRVPKIGRAHV